VKGEALSIKVGCCGWAIKGGMEAYFKTFKLIEIQSTFYKLPNPSTAEGWRTKAPLDFEFTLKSWQAITHPTSSPTWKKAGIKIPPEKADRYGLLKPTEENFEAWNKTMEIAKALKAKIMVIQCPPSLDASHENLRNMRDFLSSIDRKEMKLAIEFRHESWTPERISQVCSEYDLIHIVDPFRAQTVTKEREIIYYRLHGLGKRMYVYDYNDEEHLRLYEDWVKPYHEEGKEIYVLFNNTSMAEDANRFQEIVREKLSK